MSSIDVNALNLKKVPYKTGDELTALRKHITDLATQLRERKAAESGSTVAQKAAVFGLISDLLELKFLDAENADCVPPKGFKFRWTVAGRVLQRPVAFRTSVSAQELLYVVQSLTAAHLVREHGADAVVPQVLKLERVVKENGSKRFVALTDTSRIVLPLKFPGPVFEDCAVVELRVTFSEPPRHFAQPASFAALTSLPSLVDAGVNLYKDELAADIQSHVRRAFAAGVEQSVLISVDADSAKRSLELAHKFENSLFVAAGVHPAHASAFPPTPENIATIRKLLAEPGVCAVGEIGLDYTVVEGGHRFRTVGGGGGGHDDDDDAADGASDKAKAAPAAATTATTATATATAPAQPQPQAAEKRTPPTRADQKTWFEAQLLMAAELKLPVLLHERAAFADFVEVLKQHRASLLPDGVMVNCFSGDAAQLKAYTQELNAYVGITGLLCKLDRSQDLTAALEASPSLERLVVGTDAPYLTPFTMGAPFPKFNVPETLPHTVARLAEVTKTDVTALSATVLRNARTVFRLPTLVRSQAPVPAGLAAIKLELNVYSRPAVAKAEQVAKAAKSILPDGVTDADVFLYERKYYRVSEKERAILTKQQAALDKEKFDKLLVDFALEVVATMPERKKRAPGSGGRGRGRGRGRGGRGGGGRGAARAARPAAGAPRGGGAARAPAAAGAGQAAAPSRRGRGRGRK
jgi:Tat protein secretion system quality control protein TatD with DNase activity